MKKVVNFALCTLLLAASSGCCCSRGWYGYGNSGSCGPCSSGSYYAPAAGGCSSGQCAPAFGAPASTYTVPQGAYIQGGGAPMTALPMTNPTYSTALLPNDPLPTY